MCATASGRLAANEKGVGLLAVLLILMVLALLGTLAVEATIRDMDSGRSHVQAEKALLVAQAGLDYGTRIYVSNPSWTGVPLPGKAVGAGSFTVSIGSLDADGNALPATIKAVRSRGRVAGAYREVSALVQAIGATTILSATGAGNAVSLGTDDWYSAKANGYDGAPNAVWATGNWSRPQRGVFGAFSGSALGSGTIQKVEALVYGYVDRALTNDYVTVRPYFNNVAQGNARSISRATLNTRIGLAKAGYFTVDITRNRAWSLADFSGDLELYVRDIRKGGTDGALIYLDSVGLRVTSSGSGALIVNEYQEVNS